MKTVTFNVDEIYVMQKMLDLEIKVTEAELSQRGKYYSGASVEDLERYYLTLQSINDKLSDEN